VRLNERMLWIVGAPNALDPMAILSVDHELCKNNEHVTASARHPVDNPRPLTVDIMDGSAARRIRTASRIPAFSQKR
jgi:hypothetical protein